MQQLKFCPQCGKEQLQWDGEKKWSCRCGFVLFHNVAGAVAVVITFQDEIFLTRRNQEPAKGMLDLAGGFVDPGESAETTCIREIREELGFDLERPKLKYEASLPNIYHYQGIDYNTLDLFYSYEAVEKFNFTAAESEISEGIWISKSTIDLNEIAFDSQRKFLEKWINSITSN